MSKRRFQSGSTSTVVLVAVCAGSQPPIGALDAMLQSRAIAN
ncbi:MAG TPA: hypothetical protein VGG70_00255 [Candidatus Cybelea sp.]